MALKSVPTFDHCEILYERQFWSPFDKLVMQVYLKPYPEFGEKGNDGDLRISMETLIAELQRLNPDNFRKIAARMALVLTYAAVARIRFYFPEDEPRFLQVILGLEAYLRNERPILPDPNDLFPPIENKRRDSSDIDTFDIPHQSLKIPTAEKPDSILYLVLQDALADEGLSVVPQFRRLRFNWWLSELIPAAKKNKFPKHIPAFKGFMEFEIWRKAVLGKKEPSEK